MMVHSKESTSSVTTDAQVNDPITIKEEGASAIKLKYNFIRATDFNFKRKPLILVQGTTPSFSLSPGRGVKSMSKRSVSKLSGTPGEMIIIDNKQSHNSLEQLYEDESDKSSKSNSPSIKVEVKSSQSSEPKLIL